MLLSRITYGEILEKFKLSIAPYKKIIQAITLAGGRFVFVGGCVRDAYLDNSCKDYDAEVYGLPLDQLQRVLSTVDTVSEVGKSFGVLKLKNYNIDISVPRFDTKIAEGHRGFSVKVDYSISFKEAARRRDLTINSMGYDPVKEELLDPFKGMKDLQMGILRATDPKTFPEDPLRGLRVAQFSARFLMQPDGQLKRLCQQLDLRELPAERILEEVRKLLLKGVSPSWGLEFLEDTKLLHQILPEIADLSQQAWEDSMHAVDEGARSRDSYKQDVRFEFMLSLMLMALSLSQARATLKKLKVPHKTACQVKVLLQECQNVSNLKEKSDYLWGGKRLLDEGLDWKILLGIFKVVLKDNSELARLQRSLLTSGALNVHNIVPVVQGKHLVARGIEPGSAYKKILNDCLQIQYEQGFKTPEEILSKIFK